ncbi:Clp protease N-terminal domain-containing protein [Actinomadura atramentaria]|uniref:Clp protease N-terminal domain-containing protein n=1 Tax=Actinomadura atramentaria TaxID=1990 RepID=UPI00036F880C|nr:Clp protease N-terminal domain-containing protein [Actinomadura atramentaria]
MFERFSRDARAAVVGAQAFGRELRARRITTGHLLYAVAAGEDDAAAALRAAGATPIRLRDAIERGAADPLDPEALRAIGVDLAAVRDAAEAEFGPGALDAPDASGPYRLRGPVFADDAKKALELSLRQTLKARQKRIEAGHVLLGLIQDERFASVRLLTEAGVDVAALRADVTTRLRAAA